VADGSYTDSDLDAAIAAIGDPERLREAQDLVARAAPSLQRVLNTALHEGGWFGEAHQQAVHEAAGEEDPTERARAVHTLIAEEARLGMFVGVAVGFELARELERGSGEQENPPASGGASPSGGESAPPTSSGETAPPPSGGETAPPTSGAGNPNRTTQED
jgi:hypothetical protein